MIRNCKITDSNGNPIPDAPILSNLSYIGKCGNNPLIASMENCYLKNALGVDPITGLPVTVWDAQISREKEILEALGESVILYRELIVPAKNDDPGYRRCPNCYDPVRKQARSSCPICNGFGQMSKDPNIPILGGYEFLQNPERDDKMFLVNEGMTAQKLESKALGLTINHNLHFWTVPIRNCDGQFVNIVSDRDIMIRYMYDPVTKVPVRELGRYIMTNVSYSMVSSNQLLHIEWDATRANAGLDQKIFSLPNFLS